jgi:hypothetical protein
VFVAGVRRTVHSTVPRWTTSTFAASLRVPAIRLTSVCASLATSSGARGGRQDHGRRRRMPDAAQLSTSHADWQPREEATALERLVQASRTLKQIGESLNRTESRASKRCACTPAQCSPASYRPRWPSGIVRVCCHGLFTHSYRDRNHYAAERTVIGEAADRLRRQGSTHDYT